MQSITSRSRGSGGSRETRALFPVRLLLLAFVLALLLGAVFHPTASRIVSRPDVGAGQADRAEATHLSEPTQVLPALASIGGSLLERVVIAILGAALGILTGWWVLDDSDSTTDDGLDMNPEDRRVRRILETHDGSMKQSEIVAATGWSKAKVSRTLSRMETMGLVEKRQIGRQNEITLTTDASGD